MSDASVAEAARLIAAADALLITAGAGMGVDSGLPDFRGIEGFWKAYPPYEKLGLRFESLANPEWFDRDPAVAWGFYGHRLNLYRVTPPHPGFRVLWEWAHRAPAGFFVFTSNVDGHFQRAGFEPERVCEVHGAVDWMQCRDRCGVGIFPAFPGEATPVAVDEATMRAAEPLPACPECGALARPNILMFGDWEWDAARTDAQMKFLRMWLDALDKVARLVVVECGAGTAIPTVRLFGERLVRDRRAKLIRINVREPEVPEGQIGLAAGALAALVAIQKHVGARRA